MILRPFQWEWWDDQDKGWKKSGLTSNQSRSLIPDSSYSGYWIRVVITPKGGLFVIVKYDFIHNNTGDDQSIFQWQYKEYGTWKDFNSIETIDSKKLQLSVTKQFLFSSQNFTSYNYKKYAPISVRITPKGSKKQSITGTVVEKDMGCLHQLANPALTCRL